MKSAFFLFVFLSFFAGKSFAALDLVLPDATDRNASQLTLSKSKQPQTLPALPPAAPGAFNLPNPPMSSLPPPGALAGKPSAADAPETLRALATQLQTWQVAAVLHNTVILRAPPDAQRSQALTLTHGQPQPWHDGVVLKPELKSGTLTLTASIGKHSQLVYLGQMPQNFTITAGPVALSTR